MSNTASLYWLTRLDGINSLLGTLSVIGIICFVVWLVSFFVQLEDMEGSLWKSHRSAFLKIVIPTAFVMIVDMLTPDRDEAIFIMAGGKTLDFAAQDSSLQAIPAQTTLMISKFLEQQIEEIESTEKEAKTE
jgi:hypothetical protein